MKSALALINNIRKKDQPKRNEYTMSMGQQFLGYLLLINVAKKFIDNFRCFSLVWLICYIPKLNKKNSRAGEINILKE